MIPIAICTVARPRPYLYATISSSRQPAWQNTCTGHTTFTNLGPPDMIAVTIAFGDAYIRLAQLAAESVRQMTGLETHVLQDAHGAAVPVYVKLRLLELFPGQRVLYFDADTRFVRPWDPAAVSGQFAAVLDKSSNERDADCRMYGIDKTRYFNSGIWIAGPECSLAFGWAWDLVHKPGYKTGFKYEQTALNAGMQRYAVAVELLDRRYNAICSPETPPPPDAVVLHCAGGTLHGANRTIFEKAIADARNLPAQPLPR